MAQQKTLRKIGVARNVLAERGFIGFLIVCLEFVQKHADKNSKTKAPTGQIFTRARYSDIVGVDINQPAPAWKGTARKRLRFNWVIPPPGKGSGGHLNIFRFISFLEAAGHECRLYIYVQGEHGPVSGVRAVMGSSYPKLKATGTMTWLDDGTVMKEADGVFATSWETAYAIAASGINARRFYFVQDFEPYFHAPGSFYALAENTYKMGFYGITAGSWLSTKLGRDYGMETDHYDFGSDGKTYSYLNSSPRKEVFFYARPYTERRGFEIGIMALDLFHKKHPDYVINLAGWDVSNYDIPFPYNNLSTLEVRELNDLYNECAVALVLSFTNMSLLPLELLGSGTIPVVNDGENNRLVSDNAYIAYSANDPVSLARKMSEIVSMEDLPAYAKKASVSVRSATWEDAGSKFVDLVERETRRSTR